MCPQYIPAEDKTLTSHSFVKSFCTKQCSGSMTFCVDADPDPDSDPDPAVFIIDLQDTNKKLILVIKFFCLLLFEGTVHLHHFPKIKSPKEVTKQ